MRVCGHTFRGLERVSCALCDGRLAWPRYRKFGAWIVECVHCGLVSVNPRYPRDVVWRRYSPDYFAREYLPSQGIVDGHVDHAHFDSRFTGVRRLLEQERPDKGRLFELGAGAGLFLSSAARHGWQVRGIELSAAGAAFARDTLGVEVTAHAIEDLPGDLGTFDAVVLFDVIEHLYDPVDALRRLYAIARPGAVILVSTPNFNALSRTALGRQWSILSPLEHLYYFTEDTLQRALEAAGFSAVRFERQHHDWSMFDTLNARATHTPDSRRAKQYQAWIDANGKARYREVQAAGRGDILMAVARRPLA